MSGPKPQPAAQEIPYAIGLALLGRSDVEIALATRHTLADVVAMMNSVDDGLALDIFRHRYRRAMRDVGGGR